MCMDTCTHMCVCVYWWCFLLMPHAQQNAHVCTYVHTCVSCCLATKVITDKVLVTDIGQQNSCKTSTGVHSTMCLIMVSHVYVCFSNAVILMRKKSTMIFSAAQVWFARAGEISELLNIRVWARVQTCIQTFVITACALTDRILLRSKPHD